MRFLRRVAEFVVGIASLPIAPIWAQQVTPGQTADPTIASPAGSHPTVEPAPVFPVDPRVYREVDMLRRDGFSVAREATVSLRVFEKKGAAVRDLTTSDVTLTVNGTVRPGRLVAPGAGETLVSPMVLLVFPPNQPTIHSIGVHQAERYFSSQPNELLPWKVGILDANGKLTPFTDGRSQLLAYLDVVDHTIEPFQYWSDVGLRSSVKWEGSWLTNAEEAIALMQSFSGPKVLLTMNPLGESMYGMNDHFLAHDGPESLVQIAEHIGAHIYIANVGGPEVDVPGGDASGDRPASGNFSYRAFAMMQTAKDTMGGFSNSLKDLAGYIHRDLDENYSLTFEMTDADRDKGIPAVNVTLTAPDRRVAVLDVVPVGSVREMVHPAITKEVAARVKREARHPVASPVFGITQHVDSFPLRSGLEPLLPMTCEVEWTGQGRGPRQLSVAETVEDTNLATTILDRDVLVNWNGHSLSWERDGRLRPGHYVWRVAIHDDQGKVLTAAERKVDIPFPRGAAVEASSLVVGKSCRTEAAAGLRKRADVDPAEKQDEHLMFDPMRAADCRVKPESADRFAATDLLHAFVRIYPAGKLEKKTAENWTASFVLRSATGAVETEKDIPFTVDAGSGYLAYVEVPLNAEAITPGAHTLDVSMKGPGIRGSLKESREIEIAGAGREGIAPRLP